MGKQTKALAQLELQLGNSLQYVNQPATSWVKSRRGPNEAPALDVAIIGGGASGLSVGFALWREGVANYKIFDRRPEGQEGPWITTARMRTLRSPKHLTGPNQGLVELTFRAWFVALYDEERWEALDKIPREMWMDYLKWYRKVTGVEVQNNIHLNKLTQEDGLWRLEFEEKGKMQVQYARHVVLATGRAASGGSSLPEVALGLPAAQIAHTEDTIDFDKLKGRHVLVIGGAASAVDAAATALDNGAGHVSMFIRAKEMPTLNKFKYIVYPGFMRGFEKLPDDKKWAFLKEGFDARIAAPRDSMLRLKSYANFNLYLGAGIKGASSENEQIKLKTGRGDFMGDFVIFGTGYAMDLSRQPEIADFASTIRLWRDEFTPSEESKDETLSSYPYLGEGFQFLPKKGEDGAYLDRLHLFNAATTLSHAPVSSDIPGTNIGTERLVDHLVSRLFCDNAEAHLDDMREFAEPELFGDEWVES